MPHHGIPGPKLSAAARRKRIVTATVRPQNRRPDMTITGTVTDMEEFCRVQSSRGKV